MQTVLLQAAAGGPGRASCWDCAGTDREHWGVVEIGWHSPNRVQNFDVGLWFFMQLRGYVKQEQT